MKYKTTARRNTSMHEMRMRIRFLEEQLTKAIAVINYNEKIILRRHNRQVFFSTIKAYIKTLWPFGKQNEKPIEQTIQPQS